MEIIAFLKARLSGNKNRSPFPGDDRAREKFVTFPGKDRSNPPAREWILAEQYKKPMKLRITSFAAVSALALGTLVVYAQHPNAPADSGPRHRMACHAWGNPLDRLGKDLQLTSEQTIKIQPIIDQTRSQLKSIHETAMQQSKTAIQNAVTQVRPMLTATQQQKLDAIQKAYADMEAAHEEMKAALQQ
jgi:hypothetical protein